MDEFNRPDWDSYFMALCFIVAERSIDPNTKHGAVLISSDKRILSTGYNGPIKNSEDHKIPLTRPEKYSFLIHAESNCLLSYYGSSQTLINSTLYITGLPCSQCLGMIMQKGIKKIVCGNVNSQMLDEKEEKIKAMMIDANIYLTQIIKLNNVEICKVGEVIRSAVRRL